MGCGSINAWDFDIQITQQDTLLMGWKAYVGTNDGYTVQSADGAWLNCPFNQVVPPIFLNSGLATGFIESYNRKVFMAENNRIDFFERDGLSSVSPYQSMSLNSNWYSFAAGWRPKKHQVIPK